MRKTIIFILLAFSLFLPNKSSLYQKFEHCDDVEKVAYIRNYKIENERVDITLVRAKNQASFHKLMSELDLPYSSGDGGVMICIRDNKAPQNKQNIVNGTISLKEACLIGASESERTIYVFHDLRNEKRVGQILKYILERHCCANATSQSR